MNNWTKANFLIFLFVLFTSYGKAQIEDYEYRIPISNAIKGWNCLDLPQKTFDQSKNNLSDIRIYHKNNSTNKYTEQPYYLDVQSLKYEISTIDFKIINKTHQKDLYAFTFELSNQNAVNKIKLDFSNLNFDWKIHLEGSMDNQSWSTIVENYRIVSIKNSDIKFTHSDITIPESKFNYYKISFHSTQKPNLTKAFLSMVNTVQPNLKTYASENSNFEEDKKLKTSTYSFKTNEAIPISQITFLVDDQNDYYRPFIIEGALDSFNTEKGWKYRYKLLYQGTLNSLNENTFDFDSQIVKRIKITVYNFDNRPLEFNDVRLRGPNYRLVTRLDETENLFLVFGYKEGKKPLYDITYFKDKIPNELNIITLGSVEHFPKRAEESAPLFKNKWWLWASMIIVIVLLGSFTLKMLREEK